MCWFVSPSPARLLWAARPPRSPFAFPCSPSAFCRFRSRVRARWLSPCLPVAPPSGSLSSRRSLFLRSSSCSALRPRPLAWRPSPSALWSRLLPPPVSPACLRTCLLSCPNPVALSPYPGCRCRRPIPLPRPDRRPKAPFSAPAFPLCLTPSSCPPSFLRGSLLVFSLWCYLSYSPPLSSPPHPGAAAPRALCVRPVLPPFPHNPPLPGSCPLPSAWVRPPFPGPGAGLSLVVCFPAPLSIPSALFPALRASPLALCGPPSSPASRPACPLSFCRCPRLVAFRRLSRFFGGAAPSSLSSCPRSLFLQLFLPPFRGVLSARLPLSRLFSLAPASAAASSLRWAPPCPPICPFGLPSCPPLLLSLLPSVAPTDAPVLLCPPRASRSVPGGICVPPVLFPCSSPFPACWPLFRSLMFPPVPRGRLVFLRFAAPQLVSLVLPPPCPSPCPAPSRPRLARLSALPCAVPVSPRVSPPVLRVPWSFPAPCAPAPRVAAAVLGPPAALFSPFGPPLSFGFLPGFPPPPQPWSPPRCRGPPPKPRPALPAFVLSPPVAPAPFYCRCSFPPPRCCAASQLFPVALAVGFFRALCPRSSGFPSRDLCACFVALLLPLRVWLSSRFCPRRPPALPPPGSSSFPLSFLLRRRVPSLSRPAFLSPASRPPALPADRMALGAPPLAALFSAGPWLVRALSSPAFPSPPWFSLFLAVFPRSRGLFPLFCLPFAPAPTLRGPLLPLRFFPRPPPAVTLSLSLVLLDSAFWLRRLQRLASAHVPAALLPLLFCVSLSVAPLSWPLVPPPPAPRFPPSRPLFLAAAG